MLSNETPERAGAVAVDVDEELRRVFEAVGSNAGEDLALRRHAEQLVARRDQRAVAVAAAVLEPEREAGRGAELGDRRRHEREDERVANARERTEGAPGERLRRMLRALALVPRLERNEGERRVLAAAGEREAEHADHLVDFGLAQEEALGLLHHGQRSRLRRARRQLHVGDQVALVLGRQERRRHAREHEHDDGDDQPEDDQEAPGPAQDLRDPVLVAVRGRLEAAVEPAEDAALLHLVAGLDRLQEGGAQGRRQREGEEHRAKHRAHHDERELAIDVADRAAEEGHRQEHRDQGDADADQRRGDLAHRLLGRFARRQALLAHDPLDVLDHDDRVVDQDADGEHHARTSSAR